METLLYNQIVDSVMQRITERELIEVEASGRHVHLSRDHIDQLFGKGYQLTVSRDLSQPGQYVCEERVMIIGPKGSFRHVVILGPERSRTQVEVSLTDSIALGIKAPIRESGNLDETASLIIASEKAAIKAENAVIVAKRHVHMTPEDAIKYQVSDTEIVQMKVFGERPLIFDDVVIRVSPKYQTRMHIDYDEANACGFKKGTFARVIKKVPGSVKK